MAAMELEGEGPFSPALGDGLPAAEAFGTDGLPATPPESESEYIEEAPPVLPAMPVPVYTYFTETTPDTASHGLPSEVIVASFRQSIRDQKWYPAEDSRVAVNILNLQYNVGFGYSLPRSPKGSDGACGWWCPEPMVPDGPLSKRRTVGMSTNEFSRTFRQSGHDGLWRFADDEMVEKQCVKDGYWYREMDGSEVFNLGWISRVKNMYTKATVVIPEPTLSTYDHFNMNPNELASETRATPAAKGAAFTPTAKAIRRGAPTPGAIYECACGRTFPNGQALGGHRNKCKVPRARMNGKIGVLEAGDSVGMELDSNPMSPDGSSDVTASSEPGVGDGEI